MEIGLGRKLSKELEEVNAEIFETFEKSSLPQINNPILLILQSHLYIEHMLERFIISELPNGKLIIDKGHLSFKQKTLLAGTFSIVEPQVIDSVIQLNKLRNNLSHKYNHVITHDQVDIIGRPLGKDFNKIKNISENCLVHKLQGIVSFITGCIATNAIISENSIPPNSDKP